MEANRHYEAAQGDIYAAGISYFTIFAIFPLLMMGFAVAAFGLAGRPELLAEIDSRIKAAVPGELSGQLISLIDAAISSRTSVGVIGLSTALYAGLLWVRRLRTALTQMWGQDCETGDFVGTTLSDLRALIAAFLVSMLTIGLTALNNPISILGSLPVSWGLFTWMIARLPRERLPLRRCARAGLLAGVGFEIFKQVASIYLRMVMHGPAGSTFGPVLGVMVFAYTTARLVLFATAWAATQFDEPLSEPEPADSATAPPASD
jgi:membrane protein